MAIRIDATQPTIIEITDVIRDDWMSLLILLRDADDSTRGKAISDAMAPIDSALHELDYNRAVEYLLTVSRFALEIKDEKICSSFSRYFSQKFYTVVDQLETFLGTENEETFNSAFDLYHLLSSVWGENWQKGKRYKLEGNLFEQIALYSDALAKPIYLEKSRQSYFKGGDIENAERIARLKSDCIRNSPFSFSSTPLPDDIADQIKHGFEKRLELWNSLPENDMFGHLVHDFFGVIPKAFDQKKAIAQCTDPLLVIMENSDICLSLTSEKHSGRTSNSSTPISNFLRNHENCNRTLQRCILSRFITPFKKWLCTEDIVQLEDGTEEKDLVLDNVIDAIIAYSFITESTAKGLKDGLVAFVNGYNRYALSVLIPLFEAALRERVLAEGIWVIKHKEVKSLEEYLVFETVLSKASQIFEDNLIEFFHKWFSTKDGVGLNLRNDHCHGIMHHESYCDWITTGTILCYFFLCQPKKSSHFDIDEIDEPLKKRCGT